ncbi:MAG: hypothetical protein IT376_02225 [Polyangiaceae bacterium]|nr:hypothetical protein [Polyangiaceae bacterium]
MTTAGRGLQRVALLCASLASACRGERGAGESPGASPDTSDSPSAGGEPAAPPGVRSAASEPSALLGVPASAAPGAAPSAAGLAGVPPGGWEPSTEACRSPPLPAARALRAPAARRALGSESEMAPRATELLVPPQGLARCPGVVVVENREEAGASSVPLSAAALGWLDRVCCEAVAAYPRFARARGAEPAGPAALVARVSLVPDDAEPRSLNDLEGRFVSRAGAGLDLIDGWYERPLQRVFVPAGVLRPSGRPRLHVLALFAHELYHALSAQSGVYERRPQPRDEAEEADARAFVDQLGLPAPAR